MSFATATLVPALGGGSGPLPPSAIAGLKGFHDSRFGVEVNGARSFAPGSSQRFSVPNDPALQTGPVNFVVAGWCLLNTTTGALTLMSKRDLGGFEWQLFTISGSLTFQVNGTSSQQVTHPVPLVAGRSYFVYAWQDVTNDIVGVGIDALEPQMDAYTAGTQVSTAPFLVGSAGIGSAYWDGVAQNITFLKTPQAPLSMLWGPGGIHSGLFNSGNVPDLFTLTTELGNWGAQLVAPLSGRQPNEIDISPNGFTLTGEGTPPPPESTGKANDIVPNRKADNCSPWRLVDSSPFGTTGRLVNFTGTTAGAARSATVAAGASGQSLILRTSNQGAESGIAPQLERANDEPWSIAVFVEPIVGGLDNRDIVRVSSGGGNPGYYCFYSSTAAAVKADYFDGTTFWLVQSAASSVPEGQMTHVVCNHDGTGASGVSWFINGVASIPVIETPASPTAIAWNNTLAKIGFFTAPLIGKLDDMRIYDRILTQPEAEFIATSGASGVDPGPTNLRLCYGFDEGNRLPGVVGKGSGDVTADSVYIPNSTNPNVEYNFAGDAGTREVRVENTGDTLTLKGSEFSVTADLTLGPSHGSGVILGMGSNAQRIFQLLFNTNSTLRLIASANGGTWSLDQTSSVGVPLNATTGIGVTYDGANVRYYIDGTKVDTLPVVSGLLSVADVLCTLGQFEGTSAGLSIPASRVKYYPNRVLTDQEMIDTAAGTDLAGADVDWFHDATTRPSGTNVVDGGPATRWLDLSTVNNHLQQLGVTNRPTYVANIPEFGGPGLRFDGLDDTLQSLLAVAFATDATVFARCVVRTATAGRHILQYGTAPTGEGIRVGIEAAGNWWTMRGATAAASFGSDTVPIDTPVVLQAISNLATSHRAWRDNAALSTSAVNAGAIAAAKLALSGNNAHVDMDRIAVYDSSITDEERDRLLAWFQL